MAYSYIRSITIDHTKCGSSDSSNFPVLFSPGAVSSLKTVANGGHVQNSSGYDIIFTSDNLGTTLLSWEVESYDPTTGTILAWIKVPTVSHSADTVIYCVYGNSSISTFQGGSLGAAWDSNFKAVYHFTDDGSGNLVANDSTANANNGTLVNTPTLASGEVGKAASFVGSSSQKITCGNDTSIEITGQITLEAWLKVNSPPNEYSGIVGTTDYTAGSPNGYALIDHNTLSAAYFQVANAGSLQQNVPSNGTLPTGQWKYIAVSLDGSLATVFYIDGSSNHSVSFSGTPIGSSTNLLQLGFLPSSGAGANAYYDGLMDEVRVSNTARSADWLLTNYNQINSPGTFITLGSEGSLGNQTVSPTAISSGQTFGTPFLMEPIGPSAIPSQQSFGSPSLSGGTVTLGMSSIPTPRATGTPNIAGPVSMGAIPSGQSFGTPHIDAIQTIDPSAIPSQQSFGNPTLNFSMQIAPGSIPSGQTMGTPVLAGGPSPMLMGSIPSQQAFGSPTITGGDGGFYLFVSGKPYGGQVLGVGANDPGTPQSFASAKAPTITSQTLGRWTLDLDLYDETGTNIPVFGQSIVVIEGFERRFAGCIQTVIAEPLMGTESFLPGNTGATHVVYHVTATDKSGICDRRIITGKTYTVTDPNTGGPRQVYQVILDIVQNYLNGEGITTTPQSVPQDGSLGVLSADLTFNFTSVTDAFNQIATLSGCIWTVSPLGVLTFNTYANLPACPWPVTETSHDYFGFVFETSSLNYRNKQYAVSNLTVLPGAGSSGGGTGVGSNTETFTYTVGQPGVLTFLLPDGSTVPYGIQLTLPVGTLYSLTVNGVTQVIVAYDQWAGQEPTSPPQYGPWFWLNGNSSVVASLFGLTGATIVVNYTPAATSVAASFGQALAPVDPATGDPLAGCGSGLYEAVVQVQNVSSIAGLNAIAQAVLTKSGGVPIKVTFGTDRPDRLPGQIITVDRPDLNLNNKQMLIIYAQGIYQQRDIGGFGSAFRWQIQAQTNEDPGNFAQWYATLVSMASNALPVPDYQDATFVLAPGSSLAGGNLPSNAVPVRRTGRLLDMYVLAATPPTNQNLIITFLVNGVALPLTLTLPATATSNQVFRVTFDPNNPLYVFATNTSNDVITMSVAYQVLGANPTPVSNGTAVLRWTM